MISIVAHGILGTTYRQDTVVDGGVQGNGDVKVLHDLRRHLSTQYGDGTPITGWALSPAPSGMWLSRVERAFDADYAPAYLMVSFLLPSGQRLKDDVALNKISRAMILNHSKYINQNVIQYECDWSFLNPLAQELEGCLVPDEGTAWNYTAPTDGEVAYYNGDLSNMIQEMWSSKFARFGTVFCGWGLLSPDNEYPIANEEAGQKETGMDTKEPVRDEPISEKQETNGAEQEGGESAVDEVYEKDRVYPAIEESLLNDSHNFHKEKPKKLKRILLGVLVLTVVALVILFLINRCEHKTDDYVVSTSFKVNGVSFAMNLVEGGSFMMGADSADMEARGWEKPQHLVTLDSFYIGATEVTQELWEAVMHDNPSRFKGKQMPVESVSYDDCLLFIQKLNAHTGKNFRLPTEAEWEFAARGGIHSKCFKYAGSDNIDDVAWYWRNSGDEYLKGKYDTSLEEYNRCRPHPVKLKFPNELGLYDMTGNVIEWCSDWYDRYSGEESINPGGPDTCNLNNPGRVRRGGYFFQTERSSRNTYRINTPPQRKLKVLGFRLALSATMLEEENAGSEDEGAMAEEGGIE